MSDDLELAALLGEAPAAPDPTFRYDVFTNMAERARRRHARVRAVRTLSIFTAIGLVFPLAQGLGVGAGDVAPILETGAALVAAGAVALLTIHGPRVVLAYSRAAIRAS